MQCISGNIYLTLLKPKRLLKFNTFNKFRLSIGGKCSERKYIFLFGLVLFRSGKYHFHVNRRTALISITIVHTYSTFYFDPVFALNYFTLLCRDQTLKYRSPHCMLKMIILNFYREGQRWGENFVKSKYFVDRRLSELKTKLCKYVW